MPKVKQTDGGPLTERPRIPGYGISQSKTGMLPWSWAAKTFTESREYWICTVRYVGSFLPSLGRQATKVYSGRGADILMKSSPLVGFAPESTWAVTALIRTFDSISAIQGKIGVLPCSPGHYRLVTATKDE